MKYFGKGKKSAAAPDPAADPAADPTAATPVEDEPVDQALQTNDENPQPEIPAPDEDPAAAEATPIEPNPPSAQPQEAAPAKKSLFSRFKPQLKPQLPHISLPGRKSQNAAVEEIPSDVADATQQVAAVTVTDDPQLAAAKQARREARRAEWKKREDKWNEEYHERKRFAVINNLPMEEMEPLPDFNSDSEAEQEQDEPPMVAGPTPDQVPPVNHAGPPVSVVAEGVVAQAGRKSSMKGPFIPQSPSPQAINAGDPVQAAPIPGAPVSAVPIQPGATQSVPPPHLQRDSRADAAMAEMLGAQAYAGSAMHPPMQPSAPLVPEAAQPIHAIPQVVYHAPMNPTPIGWGGVYSEVPSQPMFGMPMHLARNTRGPMDIDPMLVEKIRRGRELANLAIEQEASGNLGAAENGYMKALELLVPASKELDVGSEFNKNVRMQQKAKIQREAAAMLDRCEQLRMFLRANGASLAIPKELPSLPSAKSSGGGGGRLRPPPPSSFGTDTPRGGPGLNNSLPPSRPPPPAPPSFSDNSDDLLQKLASRRNVLSAASKGVLSGQSNPIAPEQAPVQKPRGSSNEKCFMCNAPAEVRTTCDQTFCSKCGTQAASVFGRCPDPSCGKALSSTDFSRI